MNQGAGSEVRVNRAGITVNKKVIIGLLTKAWLAYKNKVRRTPIWTTITA